MRCKQLCGVKLRRQGCDTRHDGGVVSARGVHPADSEDGVVPQLAVDGDKEPELYGPRSIGATT